MLFNSWQFLVFFFLVTSVYFATAPRIRWAVLLIASCAFYMAFIPIYILILAATIVVDYGCALRIERSTGAARHGWFVFSILSTCAILFVFKYYDFFISNINALGALLGSKGQWTLLHMVLPIGLSFHTFQSLSYVIEVYKRRQRAERHVGIYALYVMFYPQLVAGPIERPQNLLHQFRKPYEFGYASFSSGIRLMVWGIFKKSVIADRLAHYVDPIFAHPSDVDGGELLLATMLYTYQMFCDFSGYSDIARGAARTMGIELMVNFNRPFSATSIADFWRRWHISLSTWLRDYIFVPVSERLRRWRKAGVIVAIITAFLVSGIWHGANWTFIICGGLFGVALSLEFLLVRQRRWLERRLPRWISVVMFTGLTYAFTCFVFIFFRAQSVHDALHICTRIANWAFPLTRSSIGKCHSSFAQTAALVPDNHGLEICCALILGLIVVHTLQARMDLERAFARAPRFVRWPAYQAMVIAITMGGEWLDKKSFIYFQF